MCNCKLICDPTEKFILFLVFNKNRNTYVVYCFEHIYGLGGQTDYSQSVRQSFMEISLRTIYGLKFNDLYFDN